MLLIYDNEYYLDENATTTDIVVILMKDELYSRLLPEDQLKIESTKQSYEAGLTQIKSKLILRNFILKKYPNTFEQYWDILIYFKINLKSSEIKYLYYSNYKIIFLSALQYKLIVD
jgi:hypothetical protein